MGLYLMLVPERQGRLHGTMSETATRERLMADALDCPGSAQSAKGCAEIISTLEEPKIAVFSLQHALGSRDIVLRQGHSHDRSFGIKTSLH
jgi:hypothetical protein